MIDADPKQIIQVLSDSEQAWQQGNRLVLMRNGRFHYLTLDYDLSRIVAVRFMTEENAASMVANMLTNGRLVRLSEVDTNFLAELAQKLLPNAVSYRPLLENGRCHLILGHTTDTLRRMNTDIDTLVDTIDLCMKGKRGAYISFR